MSRSIMLKILISLLIVTCGLMAGGVMAGSAVTTAQPVLQFGILHLVPYGFSDRGQPAKGYLYDIAAEMLQRSGVAHELHLMPLPRLFRNIREGTTQCMFIADVPSTYAMATFSEPVGAVLRGGILPANDTEIAEFADLHRYKIGVPAGVSFYPPFDDNEDIQKVRIPNYKSAVDMVLNDRIKAVIGNIDAFMYYARLKGANPSTAFAKPLMLVESPMKLACSRTNPPRPSDLKAIEATLRHLRQSGFVLNKLAEYDSAGSVDPDNKPVN